MKKILTFALLLLAGHVFAQTEEAIYKTTVAAFEQHYNQEEFEAIFNTFSGNMQKALPLDKTIGFLSGLKKEVGSIKKREFIRYTSSYAIYRTTFERGLLALNISLDNQSKINGISFKPFVDEALPAIERNTTKLALPFKGEWTVFWGGDTREQNHHIDHQAQRGAFDIAITDKNNQSYKTDGINNEDYYAFGKEIIAPCDAEVVLAVDGIKDNKPGILDPTYVPGNTVILKTANDEFLFFAHFKQHTVKVKEGDTVKKGQLLGLCGNSGNSSEAHLHFHIQNVEDMQSATGAKCYFDQILVNGKTLTDYSPIKGDRISQP